MWFFRCFYMHLLDRNFVYGVFLFKIPWSLIVSEGPIDSKSALVHVLPCIFRCWMWVTTDCWMWAWRVWWHRNWISSTWLATHSWELTAKNSGISSQCHCLNQGSLHKWFFHHNLNSVKNLFASISPQFLPHAITAQLLCHVPKFVSIGSLESGLEQPEISIKFELWWKKCEGDGPILHWVCLQGLGQSQMMFFPIMYQALQRDKQEMVLFFACWINIWITFPANEKRSAEIKLTLWLVIELRSMLYAKIMLHFIIYWLCKCHSFFYDIWPELLSVNWVNTMDTDALVPHIARISTAVALVMWDM